MSSHHFVKELQEPAVYFESVDDHTFEHLADLLEWSPLVLAGDKAAEWLKSMDVHVDVVLEENGANKLSQVLQYLDDKNHRAVHVVTNQSLNILRGELEKNTLYLYQFSVSVFNSEQFCYFIQKGSFSKWFPENTAVRVYSKEDLSISSNTAHVHQPSTNEWLITTNVKGIISIESANGFWVEENIH